MLLNLYLQSHMHQLINSRACISIWITDSTGTLCLTAMGSEAEKLVQFSTAELFYLQMEVSTYFLLCITCFGLFFPTTYYIPFTLYSHQNINITQHLQTILHGKILTCYIKPSTSKFRMIRRSAYQMITYYTMDEVHNVDNLNINDLNINH